MVKTYAYDDQTQITSHFNAKEFRCKCGKPHDFQVSDELVAKLETIREVLNCRNIHISSGYRCSDHDKAVGGSGGGKHTQGLAADVCCYDQDGKPISSKIVSCKAQDIGFTGIANINTAYTYTHLDVRTGKKWYGDETKGTSWGCKDLYEYYGIPRDDGKDDEPVGTTKQGVDISYCQNKVDWTKVSGIDFAILRAGFGKYTKQKDAMFESHYAGAKKIGLPIGAYWYSYATNADEARMEADACIEILKGKQFEYPIYYDVEEEKQLSTGKQNVSEIIKAFLERVEAAGYWVGLYMSASPMSSLVTDDILKRYAIWVAHVGVKKPSYSGSYGAWQYSWKGKVSGITGDVDMDYCYVDYPTQIKAKGLNGFSKNNTADDPKDSDTSTNPPASSETPSDPPQNDNTISVEVTLNGEKYTGTLTKK